jgi:NTF2-related export protein 1/2
VNPHYVIGAPDTTPSEKGDKVSLAVQVSGKAKLGKGEEAVEKGFMESFVLVPHWEAQSRNAGRGMRRWLIVSQNLRFL